MPIRPFLIQLPLLTALFLLGCASSSIREAIRFPATTQQEMDPQAAYQEAVAELEAEFSGALPNITHPRHYPRLLLHGAPSDIVIVLMHGLFESPFYVKGLMKNFHDRGYNVVVPLLAKHWAIPFEELNKADFHEWVDQYVAIVKIARKLGKKILLAGHSTGGLLAVYTAILEPELVDGLLLWSPALVLTNTTYYAAWAGTLAHGRINIDYNKKAGRPPPDPEKVAYYSPFAGNEVAKLDSFLLEQYARKHSFMSRPHWSVKKSLYAAVKVPVFLMNPKIDEAVSTSEMDFFFSALNVPKVHYTLDGETHSSTPKGPGDFVQGIQSQNSDFPGMLEKLNEFLERNFKSGN